MSMTLLGSCHVALCTLHAGASAADAPVSSRETASTALSSADSVLLTISFSSLPRTGAFSYYKFCHKRYHAHALPVKPQAQKSGPLPGAASFFVFQADMRSYWKETSMTTFSAGMVKK